MSTESRNSGLNLEVFELEKLVLQYSPWGSDKPEHNGLTLIEVGPWVHKTSESDGEREIIVLYDGRHYKIREYRILDDSYVSCYRTHYKNPDPKVVRGVLTEIANRVQVFWT